MLEIFALASQIPPAVTTLASLSVNACREFFNARAHRRFEQVHRRLRERVGDVEGSLQKLQEPERIDLFAQVLRSLVEDDDDRKTDHYAAFIEFVLRGEHERPILRLAGEALRALLFDELDAIEDWVAGTGRLQERRSRYISDMLNSRLETLGVVRRNAIMRDKDFTAVGEIIRLIAGMVRQPPRHCEGANGQTSGFPGEAIPRMAV